MSQCRTCRTSDIGLVSMYTSGYVRSTFMLHEMARLSIRLPDVVEEFKER